MADTDRRGSLVGATLRALPRPSGAIDGTARGGESCNLVPWGSRKFPLLRCQRLPLCRFGSRSGRIQGGRSHQVYRAYLCPELRTISAGCRRQDHIPARIFRSRACGECSGCPDSRSRILNALVSWYLIELEPHPSVDAVFSIHAIHRKDTLPDRQIIGSSKN
jgi:hypothetical protein